MQTCTSLSADKACFVDREQREGGGRRGEGRSERIGHNYFMRQGYALKFNVCCCQYCYYLLKCVFRGFILYLSFIYKLYYTDVECC